MKIPVLKTLAHDQTELVLLDLEDVLYICVENRTLIYHTKDASYRHIHTLSDLERHLYDFGFEMADKTNLVNFNKIRKLDSKQGKLYFEEHPTEKSKYATIAFIKQKLLRHKLLRAMAANNTKTMEYSLKTDYLRRKHRLERKSNSY